MNISVRVIKNPEELRDTIELLKDITSYEVDEHNNLIVHDAYSSYPTIYNNFRWASVRTIRENIKEK